MQRTKMIFFTSQFRWVFPYSTIFPVHVSTRIFSIISRQHVLKQSKKTWRLIDDDSTIYLRKE